MWKLPVAMGEIPTTRREHSSLDRNNTDTRWETSTFCNPLPQGNSRAPLLFKGFFQDFFYSVPARESSDQSVEGGIEEENKANDVEENPSWEKLLSKILSKPGRRSCTVRPS